MSNIENTCLIVLIATFTIGSVVLIGSLSYLLIVSVFL